MKNTSSFKILAFFLPALILIAHTKEASGETTTAMGRCAGTERCEADSDCTAQCSCDPKLYVRVCYNKVCLCLQ
ncbi:hypothetical protein LINGRAHAP2_LOCUS12651 [Linum grandiflorum]